MILLTTGNVREGILRGAGIVECPAAERNQNLDIGVSLLHAYKTFVELHIRGSFGPNLKGFWVNCCKGKVDVGIHSNGDELRVKDVAGSVYRLAFVVSHDAVESFPSRTFFGFWHFEVLAAVLFTSAAPAMLGATDVQRAGIKLYKLSAKVAGIALRLAVTIVTHSSSE